jgi:hypothetical protein
VICPRQQLFLAHLLRYFLGKLRSKSKRMNSVRKYMSSWNRGVEVIVQIVYVHVAVAETPSRCNMEVAYDLVYANTPLNTASFISLRVQALCIVFSLALLHILPSSKCPGHTGICLSYFVTGIAAASLLCIAGRVGAVTATAIFRVQMRSFLVPVQNQ